MIFSVFENSQKASQTAQSALPVYMWPTRHVFQITGWWHIPFVYAMYVNVVCHT